MSSSGNEQIDEARRESERLENREAPEEAKQTRWSMRRAATYTLVDLSPERSNNSEGSVTR